MDSETVASKASPELVTPVSPVTPQYLMSLEKTRCCVDLSGWREKALTQFLTRFEAAKAIGERLHLDSADKRVFADGAYRCRIYDAMCAGELVGRDPDTRLPINHTSPIAPLAFNNQCLVSCGDLNQWLAGLGIGVVIASDTLIEASVDSSTSDRDVRILARYQQLSADGCRNFNKVIAAEFGVSKTRIKQIRVKAKAEAKTSLVGSLPIWHPPT